MADRNPSTEIFPMEIQKFHRPYHHTHQKLAELEQRIAQLEQKYNLTDTTNVIIRKRKQKKFLLDVPQAIKPKSDHLAYDVVPDDRDTVMADAKLDHTILAEMVTRIAQLEQQNKKDRLVIHDLEEKCAINEISMPNKKLAFQNDSLPEEVRETKFTESDKNAIGNDASQDKLGYQIAHSITSLVGLKEAITWKQSTLKWVWAIALFVGVVATGYFVYATAAEYFSEPTATKVELRQQATYEYPPIILCGDTWLDVPKALSLGLSPAALSYSLGYYNLNNHPLKNPSQARDKFYRFYQTHNFSSLDEYYKTIAIDLLAVDSMEEFAFNANATSLCPACMHTSQPQKLFFDRGICYMFNFTPENGDNSRKPLNSQPIVIKIPDRTENFLQVNSLWRFLITKEIDLNIKYTTGSILFLSQFAMNIVRISSERFISLKKPDGQGGDSCLNTEDVQKNYSSQSCYAKCLSDIYARNYGCRTFYRSVSDPNSDLSPSKFCNFFDMSTKDSLAILNNISTQENLVSASSQGLQCVRDCSYECDRIVHEISMRSQIDETALPPPMPEIFEMTRKSNMSILVLQIENGALYQAGILTIKEVSTISFTTLVSNVGGALGLFVGGTMMTLLQVMLFGVEYFMDKKKRYNAQSD